MAAPFVKKKKLLYLGGDLASPVAAHTVDGKRRRVLSGKIYLDGQQRSTHMHILGSSGVGKTYLMEHMIREDIRAGRGLCLIDPAGDLYERLLRFVYYYGYEDRLILINPMDHDYSVGLNYLEYPGHGGREVDYYVDQVVQGIAKTRRDDLSHMPQLERWLRSTITALMFAGLTLAEMYLFLTDRAFRQHLVKTLNSSFLMEEWGIFDHARQVDQDAWRAPVLNRAQKYEASQAVRRMIGQQTSRIDFRQAMDSGKIILCNTGKGNIGKELSNLLGVIVIDKLVQAAYSRSDIPEEERRRFYFYIDECQNYLSEDLVAGLQELRKFGLSFVLANQELDVIREKDYAMFSAIDTNTRIKVVFAISPRDAHLMIDHLFPGEMTGQEEKLRLYRTYFEPVLGRAKAYASGTSGGQISGFAHGYSFGAISGLGESFNPDGDALATSSQAASSSASTEVFQESEFSGWSKSVVDAPFYYLEERQETSSVTFKSPEEQRQERIDRLVNQLDRHAVLKVRGAPRAVALFTPEVKNIRALASSIEAMKEKVYKIYAIPSPAAEQQIEQRHAELKALAAGAPITASDAFKGAKPPQGTVVSAKEPDEDNPFK